MIELQRRDRQHREPLLADEEGVFVGAVGSTAILHHPQSPGGNLLGYALIEDDHAISHVLLEPVACDRGIAFLAGDDGRHAAILQPAKEPAQFRAQDGVIWQPGEECLDRVEHYALRTDGIDCVPKPDEEPLKIVLARFLDLAALDMDVIEQDHFLSCKLLQIEAERANVRREFRRVFLEHHEHARLAKLRCPAHEELHGEHRLATPRGSADERGAPRGKPAAGYFIEALDAGARFGQCGTPFYQHCLGLLMRLAGSVAAAGAKLRHRGGIPRQS